VLAAYSTDGKIVRFYVSERAEPRRIGRPLEGHSTWVGSLAFSPDGRTLASTDLSGDMILWDLADPARPRRSDRLAPSDDRALAVAIAEDGRTLAAGGDGVILRWDLTDHARPRPMAPLRTGHGEVHALAFAPDGKTLAVGNGDKSVVVLDLSAADRGRTLGQPLTGYNYEVDWVSFAADGGTLASGDGDGILIWDVTDRGNPRRLVSPVGQEPEVDVVAFDPQTRTMAIAESNDNVARSMTLWDLTDPVQARRLGHPMTGQVVAAGSGAFSPDGRILVTADFEGAFMLWDLTRLSELRSDPVPDACARAGGSLDRAQWIRYVSNLSYEDGCAG
jgi:WD40 repeat protein